MSHRIQHLRGDETAWAENDIVPYEGEFALLRTATGKMKVRVGDGITPFSALHSLEGDIVRSEGGELLLQNATEYRLGHPAALDLSFPSDYGEDYYSLVSFDSGEDGMTFSYPDIGILFSGDDLTNDGVFIPGIGRHYTILFWYDGHMEGVVRGVDYAQ